VARPVGAPLQGLSTAQHPAAWLRLARARYPRPADGASRLGPICHPTEHSRPGEYRSGRAAVLVDQPAENVDAFDACARIGGRLGRSPPGDRNLEVDAAVGSGSVVVPEVGGEDALQVMTVPDQCPVQTLGAHGTHSTFGIGVARGARGGIFNCLDTNSGEHRVERGGELGVAVADHKPEPLNVFVEVHQQVTGRLGHTHRSGGR